MENRIFMLKEPNSMEECLYFTRRSIGKGKIVAWAYRILCPKCKKANMRKENKRDKYYTCPQCEYTEDEKLHESKIKIEVKYVCPFCLFSGETTTEYKRKSFYGVQAYIFFCERCKEKLGLTKKMKMPPEFEEKLER